MTSTVTPQPSVIGLAQMNEFVSIIEYLQKLRMADNRDEFVATLVTLQISREEASRYWDALDRPSKQDWREASNNTELAERLGLLLDSATFPRNLLLYRVVAGFFSDILQVHVVGERHMGGSDSKGNRPERRLVIFDQFPNDRDGQPLAIYKFVQGEAPAQFSRRVLIASAPLRRALDDGIGLSLAETLVENRVYIPPQTTAELLAKVIERGQSGERISLVGAFCPDYAYEETGNPQLPFRYTFDGVGTGVGLVAQQFARFLPAISQWLDSLEIEHGIVLGIGDFEADSDDILREVGVGRTEFHDRCRQSLVAFREAVPADLPLTLEMCDLDRAKGRLRPYAAEAEQRMQNGDFGCMKYVHADLDEVLRRIPGQYATFYERWYGIRDDPAAVRRIVYKQGAEYSALARIYCEDLGADNIIHLAGDRPEMNKFNAFFQPTPTLCAKRSY